MEGFSFKDTDRFLPLRLGATAHDTLQEFIDIDVTAEDLVGILNRNQAYKDLFARFVNQKTRTKEEETADGKPIASPTHRLIGLLGMLGSRNLIIALRIHRATEGRFPINAEGAVDIKAGEWLKFALEAEDMVLRNKLDYSETAFAAGVYFDWQKRALSHHPSFKKNLEGYCDRIWKRSIRTGFLAYFLAHHVKSLSPKQALAAGFLLQGGKLLLAAAHEEYATAEVESEEDARLTPLARLLQERDRWGVAQEEVSSHSLRYFDVFKSLAPGIRHAREPYALKGSDQVQYDLASVLYLADAMGRSWKIPGGPQDPVIQEWAHPSLKHLRFSGDQLVAAMKSAMALR